MPTMQTLRTSQPMQCTLDETRWLPLVRFSIGQLGRFYNPSDPDSDRSQFWSIPGLV
jgi:hypothetical protein